MAKQTLGPTLPPNWRPNDDNETDEDDNNLYGPALPPGLHNNADNVTDDSKDNTKEVIGPAVPSHLQRLAKAEEDNSAESSNKPIIPSAGPSLMPKRTVVYDTDSDSSDDMIGPLPPSHHSYEKINERYGDCSQVLAKNESQKQERLEREEWMTMAPARLAPVIPTKSVKHFSQRSSKSNDKSRDRERPKKNHKRDQELTELMDSYNKNQKRDVSLIDIHRDESSKKKKPDKEAEERVPFDPEKDLTVRRMNPKQTQSVLNKAKTFNDRFSLGVNKFL